MKRNKYKFAFIEIVILLIILSISFFLLSSEYLFGWIAHNWTFYLILSLIPLILIIFNRIVISIFMTMGISIGTFIGNYLGKFIKNKNISKIIDDMSAGQVYRMHHHPGFEIWIGIIIMSIIIGVIFNIIKKNEIKKRDI